MVYEYPKDYFKFRNSTIDIMKQLLKKSQQEDLEFGGTLCTDPNRNLELKNLCKGV